MIGRVARALLPKGRFVAEMGGHGCVRTLVSALIAELDRRGHDGQAANPWYFPTVEDYGERLAAAGFDVPLYRADSAAHAVAGGRHGMAHDLLWLLHRRAARAGSRGLSRGVRERIKPQLCDATGKWTADYVRLRFAAHLTL